MLYYRRKIAWYSYLKNICWLGSITQYLNSSLFIGLAPNKCQLWLEPTPCTDTYALTVQNAVRQRTWPVAWTARCHYLSQWWSSVYWALENKLEILTEMYAFQFKKLHVEMPSGKWRPFCLGLNVLSLLPLWGFFHKHRYNRVVPSKCTHRNHSCQYDGAQYSTLRSFRLQEARKISNGFIYSIC